jgi:hypothetical protein
MHHRRQHPKKLKVLFDPVPSELDRDDQPLDVILRKIAGNFLGYMETYLPIVKIGLAEAYRFPKDV